MPAPTSTSENSRPIRAMVSPRVGVSRDRPGPLVLLYVRLQRGNGLPRKFASIPLSPPEAPFKIIFKMILPSEQVPEDLQQRPREEALGSVEKTAWFKQGNRAATVRERFEPGVAAPLPDGRGSAPLLEPGRTNRATRGA